MSLLLPGEKMPETCDNCPCTFCSDPWTEPTYCALIAFGETPLYGKREDCPLIEVPDEPKTRADRIRQMTDEELMQFLKHSCCICREDADCEKWDSCEECWMSWLKEDAEE